MTTTTTVKPLTQRQIKQGLAPKVSHAKAPTPPAVISEIHLIPLDRITIKEQPRHEFHEDSIEELAKDIEAHGLLQPIIVNPIGDEHYRLVCGERRLRAIKHLKQKAIPAIVSKIGDNELRVIQLAENIQREDMNLHDTAQAIRELFDTLGSLDAVCQRVSKSKPWVSKMVATTCDKFGWRAKGVLESGLVDDMELLHTLNQIEKQCTWQDASKAFDLIREGKLSRQQARDLLKDHKENKEKQAKQTKEEKDAADKLKAKKEAAWEKERKAREEGHGEEFLDHAISMMENSFNAYTPNDNLPYLRNLNDMQIVTLEAHFDKLKKRGETASIKDWAQELIVFTSELTKIELLAMILSTQGVKVGNFIAFMKVAQEARMELK